MSRRARRGLTLLELLVALLLASLVMLMAGSAVRATLRMVGDGAVDRDSATVDARVRALLSSQIAWVSLREDRSPVRLVARQGELELATLSSLQAPHRRVEVRASWKVVTETVDGEPRASLVYGEKPSGSGEAAGAGLAPLVEIVDRVALEGMSEIDFAYLSYDQNGRATWSPVWTGEGLPRGFRLRAVSRGGEERAWVVPVLATF